MNQEREEQLHWATSTEEQNQTCSDWNTHNNNLYDFVFIKNHKSVSVLDQ